MDRVLLILISISWVEATFLGITQAIFGGNSNSVSSQDWNSYKVYWNVPTFMCHQYGMAFNEVRGFGIEQNGNDNFRGEKIAILYDPGMFPALLKHPNGSLQIRNGGVPQEGNLQKHLNLFKIHLEEQIIEPSFSGLGVIDFESWRPIFRQNWASLASYREFSIRLERKKHPLWDKLSVEREASQKFETAGRVFMEETLKLAKALRPYASWSYYAYPYCFNLTPQQTSWHCEPKAIDDNDNLSWLWKLEDMLLPSVYLRNALSTNKKIQLIAGRLREAMRLAENYKPSSKVFPYFWYKYQDQRDLFLSKEDIANGFKEMVTRGVQGHILWGSSNDFNSEEKCQQFRIYFNDILGPAVAEAKKLSKHLGSNKRENIIRDEIVENNISHNRRSIDVTQRIELV